MKVKFGVILFAVVAVVVATIGTVAYFSKSFTSNHNTVTATAFDVEVVNSDGTVIGDADFDLNEKLFPGMEPTEVYQFQINKNKTELPVQYKVNFQPSGDLFPEDGNSPVVLTLQKEVNGEWKKIEYQTEFKPEVNEERFRVLVEWPHGDNDIAFQGKTGNIKLEVVATQIDAEIPEPEEKGEAHISLYRDSTSSSNKIDFDNITNFTLKSKLTNREYTVGSTPWNQKHVYKLSDVPVGEYTIHFDYPNGMSIKEIQIGESYKETTYNPETNPFVITEDKSSYAKIVLKSDLVLKEIKPLADLTVPSDITYDEFNASLPQQATIVDSANQEHQVDLKWDIRPSNFENYKKPGTRTLWSELFKLPVNVSNTDPATRLEVKLNVTFE